MAEEVFEVYECQWSESWSTTTVGRVLPRVADAMRTRNALAKACVCCTQYIITAITRHTPPMSCLQSCLVSNLELERKYFRKKEVPKKGIFEIFFCYILHEQKQMKKMRKLIRTNSYPNLQYFRILQI